MDIDEQTEPSDDTNIRSETSVVEGVDGARGIEETDETRRRNESIDEDNLLIEEHGINPNYPRVLVRRISLSSAVEENSGSGMEKQNANAEPHPMETSTTTRDQSQIPTSNRSRGISSPSLDTTENAQHTDQTTGNETNQNMNDDLSMVQNPTNNETVDLNNSTNEDRQHDQIAEVGIDPSYPIVLVRRLSLNEIPGNHDSMTASNPQDILEGAEDVEDNAMDSASDSTVSSNPPHDDDQQQQIEDAGIDPNYPRVLVQRVSLPANDDDSPVVERANAEENSLDDEDIPANVLDLFHIDRAEDSNDEVRAPAEAEEEEEEEEDVDDDLESWSEADESVITENPNLREFNNQFVVIRNMIAQTRRSMAEAEANFGPSEILPRNMLMQRFRRILFILNNRRRRLIRLGMNTLDEENPEGEANAEMEAANDDQPLEQDMNDGTAENDEDNMTMEQEEEMTENAVRFDTDLPAEHSYLGSNMNRVSGVNYLDAGQYIKLRLFIHQHVLFPGEVLPFMVDSSTTIIEGDADEQNGILFGVCFPSLTNNNAATNTNGKNELYGVTCQIYELGTDDRGNTLIKSRALQRFVTQMNDLTVPLEYINSHPRMKCTGFVKILPDIYLPEPLKTMNMGSMNRFRDNPSMQITYRRFQAATTPWPVHVYEAHNMTTIIEKARTQLAQHKIDTMPQDPTQLSYWLVRNLHLPEKMLKSVFLANTVNTRLKLIASTFKEESVFNCRSCGTHIANCRELFAMSKHGVQSQYCNSAGYIHETNTVYQVNRQNILYNGSPSTEFSWFPGYQWHIIVCKICEHHLGWEFKAVEPNLIPKQFFGISSGSVRIRSANERNELTQRENAFYNFIRLMNAGVNID
ncbi:E3 ubiquitin ligase component cereblon [Haematobia irritans]|uniref:E3 ubiquitin ligase component cereblon n=1 Tax=Haematobia irritans TaxID=7368 RepID=UPI003F507F2F